MVFEILKPLLNMKSISVALYTRFRFSRIGYQKPWIWIVSCLGWCNHTGKIHSYYFSISPIRNALIPDGFVLREYFSSFSKDDSFPFACGDCHISFNPNNKQYLLFKQKLEKGCSAKASISSYQQFLCRINFPCQIDKPR